MWSKFPFVCQINDILGGADDFLNKLRIACELSVSCFDVLNKISSHQVVERVSGRPSEQLAELTDG